MVIELAGVFSPSRAIHPTMTMDRHQYTYMYNSKVTLSIIKKKKVEHSPSTICGLLISIKCYYIDLGSLMLISELDQQNKLISTL